MSPPSGVLAPPPLPLPKASESNRASLFARFMNGLKESPLQEARRVIERHSHLMAPDNLRDGGAASEGRIDETLSDRT